MLQISISYFLIPDSILQYHSYSCMHQSTLSPTHVHVHKQLISEYYFAMSQLQLIGKKYQVHTELQFRPSTHICFHLSTLAPYSILNTYQIFYLIQVYLLLFFSHFTLISNPLRTFVLNFHFSSVSLISRFQYSQHCTSSSLPHLDPPHA